PGAPQVWPEAPGNICYDWHLGDAAAVETAIGKAARVVKLDLTNNRLVPNAMEPRAAIGEFDRATGEHTLYTTSQNPHVIRLLMVSTFANMRAYLSTFATCVPTYLYGTLLAGTYTTPAIYVETKAVFTHTVPVDAYRGAGRPEATYLLERIVDLAADELGMDPAELRRRNFIPANAFPYQTPVALQYDSRDYQNTLDLAMR